MEEKITNKATSRHTMVKLLQDVTKPSISPSFFILRVIMSYHFENEGIALNNYPRKDGHVDPWWSSSSMHEAPFSSRHHKMNK
jgi:hypothetical protein